MFMCNVYVWQGWRNRNQILADKLTLFQPFGQIMPTKLILAPPDFQTLRHPCMIESKIRKSSFAQMSNVDQISYCKKLYSRANKKIVCTKEFKLVYNDVFSKQSTFKFTQIYLFWVKAPL